MNKVLQMWPWNKLPDEVIQASTISIFKLAQTAIGLKVNMDTLKGLWLNHYINCLIIQSAKKDKNCG